MLTSALASPHASRAQYTPGNLVVLRVGDGSTSLSGNSAAAPVALAEYTPAGVLRNTTPLPSAGTDNKLTNTGNAQSEGMLTLSANGQYLLTTGYNAAAGTAAVSTTTSAAVPRTVARIDGNRGVDISTALANAYSGNTIRSAASLDGTSFFLSGSTGGIRYAPMGTAAASAISTTVASPRVTRIYRGRVYFSAGSGSAPGIYVIDAATNTASGQTATSFLPTASGTSPASPYGFVLLDRDRDVPGFDAAYVADDGIGGSAGGIQKWSFDGTAWTKRGSIGTAYRGLTGTLNPDGSATLYATTNTSAGGNDLVTVTDTNPYDAAPSSTTVSLVASAAPNVAFRGVDFAPGTAVVLPVVLSSFGASRTAAGVHLRWATASETNSAHFAVERSPDGLAFTTVATVAAAGTSQQAHTYAHFDAAPAAALYYRLRQIDLDGTARYSPVVAVPGAGPELALSPNPVREHLRVAAGLAAAYTVRTALGQPVRQGTTEAGPSTVPVGDLPAGLYFFELQTSAGRVVRRFVKE